MGAPALYVGTLRHRRFAPTAHHFRYSLFMALLDIDRIPETMAVSRLTGYNTWNWSGYDDRDHIGDPSRPLRERLREHARVSGVDLPEGPVYLLTHLRYAGYVFNPISFYYCYDPHGRLRMVLADVRNTYGGRHGYWLKPDVAHTSDTSESPATRRFRAVTPKALYVSPFMERAVNYEFVLTPPQESLVAHMNVIRPSVDGEPPSAVGERVFDATLTLDRRPWTPREVRSILARFPWMTAKVMGAIHWEALRLRLRGLPVIPQVGQAR